MTSRVISTIRQVRDVLTREQTEIIRTAGLLMIPALLTKITGLAANLLTSNQLGVDSASLNEFLFANALPQLLADILLTGAVSTLVIPIFIQVKEEEGDAGFQNFFNTIVNLMLMIFAVVAAVVILFAPQIFPLVMNYIVRPSPEVYALIDADRIIQMLRALMVPQFILGASVFLSAGLNVYDQLLIPQFAPFFYNIGRIFSVLILLPLMNGSPWALIVGVVLGSILHFSIQLPLSKLVNLKWRWFVDWRSKHLWTFFKVAWPRLLAYSADTVSSTLTSLIIAGYNIAFLSVMYFASSLINIIPGVIGYSFSVASFASLSRHYQRKEYEEVNEIMRKIINQIVFLSLPIILTLIILRLPTVRLMFGALPGTYFDRDATLMVAWATMFAGPGIIFAATRSYLYRLFYIAKNTFVPLLISLLTLFTDIIFTIIFANLFSHMTDFSLKNIVWDLNYFFDTGHGLAAVGGATLAFTLSSLIEFVIMLILINKFVVKIKFQDLLRGLALKAIPTIATAGVMYAMYKLWDTYSFPIDAPATFVGSTTLNLFLLTSLTVFTSWMVYFLLCYLLGVEEIRILRRVLNPVFRLGGLHIK
jgi:putative peptidoglycan lipid II flippase